MGRTPTRVGVVGYGYWGSKHVRVLNSLPDVEVTVIDNDQQRLREAMASFPSCRIATDLSEELESQDAVVVATPPGIHANVGLQALEAGLHTLIEKPLANSIEEAEALVAASEKSGARLMVGHTFEYNPAVWKLKEIISSGELGRVLYIDAARLSLGRYQTDCNVIWDLAPHDISIVSYLLDEVPQTVSVWAQHNIGTEHADVAYLKLEFEKSGAPAFVHLSWLHPEKTRRVTVVGEKKMAVYNDMSDNERIRIYDVGVDPKKVDDDASHGFPVSYRTGDIVSPFVPFQEPLLVQDSHFIECVRTGAEPRTPGQRGLDIVKVLAATDVAGATGAPAHLSGNLDLASVGNGHRMVRS
ncbi:Gfo/Idh/MocA family protein [Pseudonocardia spinosispora]|uniref:Gfo/Idh/MocA family protein n=1 Tax=Pseudonocardia spinosispora TaxID=103441 RepID=UPI0004010192|nr:Gfo/Idh/MocA family oxidoreductase [Pseudonocardia spinosispora]